MSASVRWILILFAVLTLHVTVGQGCGPPPQPNGTHAADGPPTLRLVLLSNVAGAIEPCGCTEDQLGGIDHLGALLDAQRPRPRQQVLLSVGALPFDAPVLQPKRETQSRWKAETIATSLKDLGLLAWTPGAADFAAGGTALAELRDAAAAQVVALNLDAPAVTKTVVTDVGGTKLGVLGVSALALPAGITSPHLPGKRAEPVAALAQQAAADLERQGAQLLVALAAVPRAEAMSLLDAVPAINLLVIGDPAGEGLANDAPTAPMLLGSTLVVQTANHVQTASVVDIRLRQPPAAGWIRLADGGGLARDAELASLARRIAELEARIDGWEASGRVDARDLAARKADLAELREQRQALEQAPLPPAQGNTFRYQSFEVREGAGTHPLITQRLAAMNQRVNDHNRVAFADRKPPPAAEGQPTYVGVDECTKCHAAARKHWDARPHARAYATLQRISREYDLDCVGCHVTGYERPGGSTVTHNEGLKDVQCEVCHGPGSKHVADPTDPAGIILRQEPRSCVEACHHSPHVEDFDPVAKMPLILGPGHGAPPGE